MSNNRNIPWSRIFGEGVIIVVSILLAFWIQAWWDSRNEAIQRDAYLVALARDFEQMHVRAEESHGWATRGSESGRQLSALLQNGATIDQEFARESLFHLLSYEVFSPSVGAYQALLSTGNLDLLDNGALKLELRDFFGYFDDVRATEQLQLASLQEFSDSPIFGQLAGWHRLDLGGIPIAGDLPVERWAESDEFMSAIGALTIRHNDSLADYEELRKRIRSISASLATEVSNQKRVPNQ